MKTTFTRTVEHRGATIKEDWQFSRDTKVRVMVRSSGTVLSTRKVEIEEVPNEILQKYLDSLEDENSWLQAQMHYAERAISK